MGTALALLDIAGAAESPGLVLVTTRNWQLVYMFYGGRVNLAMGPGTPPANDLAGQIKCPVAGYFGALDQDPSPEDVADISAALDAAGVAHEFHSYEGANHGFQMFGNPERYHAEASEDAWQKALDFLKRRFI